MKIEVLTTQWAHDGGVLAGGVHEIEKPTAKLLAAAAAAEAVGSVKVTASADEREKMRGSVESDSESEKKLTQAMADSTWHEGNLGDFIAVKSALLKEHGDTLPDETRASLELGITQAKAILKELAGQGKKRSYDEAARKVLAGG